MNWNWSVEVPVWMVVGGLLVIAVQAVVWWRLGLKVDSLELRLESKDFVTSIMAQAGWSGYSEAMEKVNKLTKELETSTRLVERLKESNEDLRDINQMLVRRG